MVFPLAIRMSLSMWWVGLKCWKPAPILSVISSFRDNSLPQDLVVFGEVGLAGEIRPVANGQERLREAAKHGFTRAIVPAGNAPKQPIQGMKVIPVRRVTEALDAL